MLGTPVPGPFKLLDTQMQRTVEALDALDTEDMLATKDMSEEEQTVLESVAGQLDKLGKLVGQLRKKLVERGDVSPSWW